MKPTPQLVSIAAPELEFESVLTTSTHHLFGLDSTAIIELMGDLGEPIFRARQLSEGLYRQRLTHLDQFTTLPLTLRQRLAAEGWSIGRPTIAQTFTSADQTERYLINLPIDAFVTEPQTVETVWMPEGDNGESGEDDADEEKSSATKSKRATICVSSQVGCAVNCQFCLTARLGLKRNLSAGEIAGQVVTLLDRHALDLKTSRLNLVFMGMGEPFLNYANFSAAVRLLVEQVGLSPRRMTVSTSGILPGLEHFAQEPLHLRPRLAISLNAPNDSIRDSLMPINRKWPIRMLIDALRKIQLRPHERITFEYVLLGGITDQPEHARELANLIRRTGIPIKVNLIAWNPGPSIPFTTPAPERVEAFRHVLIDAEFPHSSANPAASTSMPPAASSSALSRTFPDANS